MSALSIVTGAACSCKRRLDAVLHMSREARAQGVLSGAEGRCKELECSAKATMREFATSRGAEGR